MTEDGFRSHVLLDCGAPGPVVEELIRYDENPFAAFRGRVPAWPLADEPHIDAWLSYAADARDIGVFQALQRRFVQLRFPIQAGMSAEAAYRSATLRGHLAEADAFAPGLVLSSPSGLHLDIHPTIAGRIPVLVADDRGDFVALVRAFTDRNEPGPVPPSMGACIVTGLNNWDRIAAYRRAWEAGQQGEVDDGSWGEEFKRLIPQKALYQDRFIILSRGPYSATAPSDTGMDESEWLARSLVIRREHELTHYFTYRVFGAMRNNVLDELVADFVGLVRAFGTYRADLARRFLGLEDFPAYRQGGRLQNYRGDPPLSDEAFAVLVRLAYRVTGNLERFAVRQAGLLDNLSGLARVTFALVRLTVEELASSDMLALASRLLDDGAATIAP
jgi:hypothetical protein